MELFTHKDKSYLDQYVFMFHDVYPLYENLKGENFSLMDITYVFQKIFGEPVMVIKDSFEIRVLRKRDYSLRNEKVLYSEDLHSTYWFLRKWDGYGNLVYEEYSNGYWYKYEYNQNGDEIYYEDSEGTVQYIR